MFIIAMLTLFPPSKQDTGLNSFNSNATNSPVGHGNFGMPQQSNNNNYSNGFSFGQIPISDGGAGGVSEGFQEAKCTPLGDIYKLMQLETKYLLYYGERAAYVHSVLYDVRDDAYIVQENIKARNGDDVVEAVSLSMYDKSGKCIQRQVSIRGMEQYFSGSKGTVRCAGYPLWLVCGEIASSGLFDRNETVKIRGVAYNVKVIKSGKNELWIGYDPPILFKYYFEGDTTNKSFSVELIDINYRGAR
ncbi:MAG: hypothetical protein N3G76_02685 [Candidatus Micrarchaeota archaeon]|nr:hypothetical protein [Candidatus Micrarchaeota archaeon]